MGDHNSNLTFLGIIPKCPFYRPVRFLIILVMIVIGTWGISFLNIWLSVSYLFYSILIFGLVLPLTICRYCFYKTKIEVQFSVAKWKEIYLNKWVSQGKIIRVFMGIIWLLPIILIFISFFVNFSFFGLLSLIGCIVALGVNVIYMNHRVCSKCTIKNECHSSFED
jgi:hypothetical protein